MKQSKNSLFVSFQIRWEKVGKASWIDWRLITPVALLIVRLIAMFIGK